MSGLIGYWAFDETSGTNAIDSSGNNKTGIVNGAIWTTGGHLNNALSFDGTNDLVTISDNFDPTAYTEIVWVKPSAISSRNIFVRTSSSGPTVNWSHQIWINSTGQFVASLYDGSGKNITGTTIITPNTWYVVAVTASNNGQMILYVNGVQEGAPVNIGTMWTGGDRYYVGSNSGGGVGYFQGTIDEVKLYNRVLSSTEIAGISGFPSPTPTYTRTATSTYTPTFTPTVGLSSGMVGYWNFNDGTGADSSGRGHPVSLGGSPIVSTGYSGSALSFTGTTSSTVGYHADFAPTNGFTFSAWLNPSQLTGSTWRTAIFTRYAVNQADLNGLYFDVNGNLKFEVNGLSPNSIVGPQLLVNQWSLVTAVYDKNGGQIRIYVNGDLVSVANVTGTASNNTSVGLSIGGAYPMTYYKGKIDEIRFYNRPLTSAEVSSLYAYPTATPLPTATNTLTPTPSMINPGTSDLIGWWSVDETSGMRYDLWD